MSGVVVSKNATTTPDCAETLAAIASEIRARAGAWPDEKLAQYDLRLADRIEDAARREAAKLIPAKNIEFSDGHGRRQVSEGWVKVGNVGDAPDPRPATEEDIESGKAKWCSVCVSECPDKGKDLLCICERFREDK